MIILLKCHRIPASRREVVCTSALVLSHLDQLDHINMSSSDEEEEEFRHLLVDLPSTLSTQTGGPHTNSIASTAVRVLGTYRGAKKGKGGVTTSFDKAASNEQFVVVSGCS